MRRAAYICSLALVWLAGMGALMLGMDSLLHPPFFPLALFAGGSFAALATVSLAEEVAEWKAARNRTGSLPCRWEGWRKGDHIVFVDERTRPIRLWPRPRYDFTRAGRGRRSSL